MSGVVAQFGTLFGGIVTVAVASGLYIGAHFGPGPRDGLMTGLHARLGWPVWLCRGSVEVTVLLAGWMLGGTVGIGTILFAALIGPLVHLALPLLDATRPRRERRLRSVLAELRPVRAGLEVRHQRALGNVEGGIDADRGIRPPPSSP